MATNPLTEARTAIVTALESLGVTVYGAPPEVVTPPAALVMAGEPWSRPKTYTSTEVNLVVTLLATMAGSNASAMERLEVLTWESRMALQEIGVVGESPAPKMVKVGTAELAAADLTVTVNVTDT